MPPDPAHPTRQRLCETAMEIAARSGLQSMTLDNLARTAGVSKGGVMHHFPTKDRLVEAVVEHFGTRLEQMVLELVASDPNPRFRWARAFLDCTFASTSGPPAPRPRSTPASRSVTRTASRPAPGLTPPAPTPAPAPARDHFLDPVVIDRFFLSLLSVAASRPGLIAPLRNLGHRIQQRLLADPADGLDQLLIWLALDGLLLWQFAGLLDRNDPLFQQIGQELRQRLDLGRQPALPAPRRPASPGSPTAPPDPSRSTASARTGTPRTARRAPTATARTRAGTTSTTLRKAGATAATPRRNNAPTSGGLRAAARSVTADHPAADSVSPDPTTAHPFAGDPVPRRPTSAGRPAAAPLAPGRVSRQTRTPTAGTPRPATASGRQRRPPAAPGGRTR